MADDIFTIPTEIVARLRFESARCKAWNARWGEILTDFYAEAADEIERLRDRNQHVEVQWKGWIRMAERLVQYINQTGPQQFDDPFDVIAYLDRLNVATND